MSRELPQSWNSESKAKDNPNHSERKWLTRQFRFAYSLESSFKINSNWKMSSRQRLTSFMKNFWLPEPLRKLLKKRKLITEIWKKLKNPDSTTFRILLKILKITWTFYFDLPLLLNSKNVNSPKESRAFHRFPFWR